MHIKRGIVAAFLAVLAWCGPALAQSAPPASAPPTFVRGKIASLEGRALAIVTREGPTVSVKLAEPLTVSAVKPVELSTVTRGSYVGIAAEPDPGADGRLRAQEVLVFPDAMRGAGEGHRSWDLTPRSTMTNATVDATVEGRDGRDLQLAYKGGQTRIRVPPGVPVVTLVPAAFEDLRPGVPVFLGATKQPDGTLTAARITIGKDGVAPPM